jgi:hypothetical protein
MKTMRKTIMKINLHKLSRNIALTSFIYCLERSSSPRAWRKWYHLAPTMKLHGSLPLLGWE